MDQFSAPSGAISEHDDPEYEKYYWHNGARLAPDQSAYCLNDRGFNYGHGLFETFRIRQGCPLFWSAHEKRLIEGLLRLGLLGSQDLEGFIDQLKHEVANLVFPQPQGVLKLVVTAGSGPRGYAPASALRQPERFYSWSPQTIAQNAISDAVQTTATDTDCARAGQALMVCAHRLPRHPALAGIKHLNRLDQVLGATEAKHLGFDDGLMLDQAGFVIESTTSNVFVVRDGILLTPDVSQVGVAGVMRSIILEAYGSLGSARTGRFFSASASESGPVLNPIINVTALTLGEVWAADEVFLTNVVRGVVPVSSLTHDGKTQQWPSPGPLATQIAAWIETTHT